MGAGAVRGQPEMNSSSETNSPQNNRSQTGILRKNTTKTSQSNAERPSMSCEACSVNFNIFKRKKTCSDCGRRHCSRCLVNEAQCTTRRCAKCHLLTQGNFTRHDLQKFEVRDLRSFLSRKGVNMVLCSEKNDFIELALRFSKSSQHFKEQLASQEHTAHLEGRKRQHDAEETQPQTQQHSQHVQEQPEQKSPQPSQRQPSQRQPPQPPQRQSQQPSSQQSSQQSSQSQTASCSGSSVGASNEENEARMARMAARQQEEMAATETLLQGELHQPETDQRPRRQRACIEALKEEGDINDLTVRQLKEILITNHVDYKGCVEKCELVSRVRRLWEDNKQSRDKFLETGDAATTDESDLCKVCMDAVIDCVLLECGHMLTCTKCGRQLAECPVCRQYVVRVVHTFRA